MYADRIRIFSSFLLCFGAGDPQNPPIVYLNRQYGAQEQEFLGFRGKFRCAPGTAHLSIMDPRSQSACRHISLIGPSEVQTYMRGGHRLLLL